MFTSPAKCIPSVTKTSLVLHFLGSLWYAFGIYHDRRYHIDAPIFNGFGGRFKYLTMISAYLTFIFSMVAFSVDLIQLTTTSLQPEEVTDKNGYTKNSSRLIRIRDELISCWVYLGCTIVPILYWGLIVVDYDGIHNEETEKRSPLLGWYNQFLHTIPLPYVVLLISCVNYEYRSVKRVFISTSLATIAYISWMAYCAKVNGLWAYPILQKQTTPEFIVFIGVCIVIIMLLQLSGRKISSVIWSEQRRQDIINDMKRE